MARQKQPELDLPIEEPFMRTAIITDTLEENYMPYAMSVIVSRAIPEIDGFKPAHRKLLYTMYKMGLLTGQRTKSANIVGQTMKLNPHGDMAIYDTLVRLTVGNGALLHPYIDSKGNFGKQFSRDMQCAAPRYTEAALMPICQQLFKSIEKETVDMVPNYDGTLMEPRLLPVTFPSILVNANQGIAVGMASNICSFNLAEVCRATAAYIDTPDVDLLSYMPAPDFSGGGCLVYDPHQMAEIYETGRGSFKLRARHTFLPKDHLIEITEIPYTTTVEQVIDEVIKAVKLGKLKDVIDIRDETDLKGLKLTIELKRSADPDRIMQLLYAQTSLESAFSCNFNVLVNGYPKVLGIRALLKAWLEFRRSCFKKELTYELAAKEKRRHLLEGLAQILLDIDRAIAIIRQTDLESEVVPRLCEAFSIDAVQAEYVAEIKLRHLNREYLLKRTHDLDQLIKDIKQLEKKLKSQKAMDADIKKALLDVANTYGDHRKTELIDVEAVETLPSVALIEDFKLKAFLTQDGYLKKLALTSLRNAGDLKLKEGDQIAQAVAATNLDEVIFLTNRCNAYKTFFHVFEAQKPSDLGAYLPNILDMEADEKVIAMIVPPADYRGSLLFGFENGKVARIPLSVYQTKTKRKKLVNAYSDKSPVVGVIVLLPPQDEFGKYRMDQPVVEADCVMISEGEKVVLFDSRLIGEKPTRQTQGIQVLSGKKKGLIKQFDLANRFAFEEAEYYRIRKVPSVGYYAKPSGEAQHQLSIADWLA